MPARFSIVTCKLKNKMSISQFSHSTSCFLGTGSLSSQTKTSISSPSRLFSTMPSCGIYDNFDCCWRNVQWKVAQKYGNVIASQWLSTFLTFIWWKWVSRPHCSTSRFYSNFILYIEITIWACCASKSLEILTRFRSYPESREIALLYRKSWSREITIRPDFGRRTVTKSREIFENRERS